MMEASSTTTTRLLRHNTAAPSIYIQHRFGSIHQAHTTTTIATTPSAVVVLVAALVCAFLLLFARCSLLRYPGGTSTSTLQIR
jgi:hypothetical protein